MRLLHTSDWHVGKLNYGKPRDQDHEYVFEQIVEIARAERVDVILHTGDLFDKAEPGPEILRRGFGYIDRLSEIAPVVMLPGNHDADGIFALVDGLIGRRRPVAHPISIVHNQKLRGDDRGLVVVQTRSGLERILVASVPFVKGAAYARQMLQRQEAPIGLVYSEQLARLEHYVGEALDAEYNYATDVRVFAAHLLVNGATVGGLNRGERRLEIEFDGFGTDPAAIPNAEYLAFGHIHKPQVIPGHPHGRYAGSPLAVDFGESDEEKGVFIVDAKPGLPISEPRFIPLDVGRPLVTRTVAYADLPTQGPLLARKLIKLTVVVDGTERNVDDYVKEHVAEAEIAKLDVAYAHGPAQDDSVAATGPEKTLPQMFSEYLGTLSNTRQPDLANQYFERFYDAFEASVDPRIAELDII